MNTPFWAIPGPTRAYAYPCPVRPPKAIQGPFVSELTANQWIHEMERAEYIRSQWCLAALGSALLLVGVVLL
jgi:hypothetical protein